MSRATSMAAVPLVLVLGCSSDGMMKNDAENEAFRFWCGDHACAWEVAAGEVTQVATWHRKATGLRFDSDPTLIYQVVPIDEVGCLVAEVRSDITGDAALYFEVDYCNDGLDDRDTVQQIADMDWETVRLESPMAEGCDQARIALLKTGPGSAIVALADISGWAYCAGTAP